MGIFTRKKRVAMCIHCGMRVEYIAGDQLARREAWGAMKKHDERCPKNPLVAEVKRLKKEISEAS